MNPIISVIIPVKRNVTGLSVTVDALHALDQEGIEIIVVDGGGCAETKTWLLQHQSKIDHVRSAPDGGIYAALNYGIGCANGQWIWCAGAGDLPIQGTWKAILNGSLVLDEKSVQIFSVEMDGELENGVPTYYKAQWDESLIWRNTAHHQGFLYPKSMVHEVKFDTQFKVLADYALHLSWWNEGRKAELHRSSLSMVESGGISRQFTPSLYLEEWRLKRQILRGWRKWLQPFWLFGKFAFKKTGLKR